MSLASSAGPILIGLLVHSALYGIYLVFFIGALYVEYMRRLKRLKTNAFLFTVTVVLFLFITAAWVIQILRTTDASINGNFENYYLAKTPQNAANVALHVGQIIVADSTMLYRLYIVWGRSRRIVLLPLILTIGLIGAGCGVIYSMIPVSRATGKLGLYLSSPVGSFSVIVSFLGATLILNLAISGLISYRVWTITREVVGLTGGHKAYSIVYILLENAALYIGCIGSSLVGFTLDEAYQFNIMDATGPMIGITFCLIIVWVGLGMGIESTSQVLSSIRFHHPNGVSEQSIRL